jgi:nicotinamidase-related amidase
MKVLLVIDMQNDFIDGALGTKEAVAIVPNVIKKIKEFDGVVYATRDTHEENYLDTQAGKNLPVKHCVRGSKGWQIQKDIQALLKTEPIDKPTFGSVKLGELLVKENEKEKIESITLVGLCTDICVISNAMVAKANFPEVPIYVDAACCAGVTPESHERALAAMGPCQIHVVNA